MGACFVTHSSGETVQIGDDGRCADLSPGRHRALTEQAERARRSRKIMDEIGDKIAAAVTPVAADAYRARADRQRRREQHDIEAWAKRYADDPCLLERIWIGGVRPLARWEAPERIIQVAQAALNEPGADEPRLRGAILFAERVIAAESAKEVA